MFWLEAIISFFMGTLGGYYMYRGRKIQNPKMIIWGGVMIVLSYFLFSSGSKDDDASKAALKILAPGTTADQPQEP
jgi:hypothetical protein